MMVLNKARKNGSTEVRRLKPRLKSPTGIVGFGLWRPEHVEHVRKRRIRESADAHVSGPRTPRSAVILVALIPLILLIPLIPRRHSRGRRGRRGGGHVVCPGSSPPVIASPPIMPATPPPIH